MPKITVYMPNHNYAQYIDESIQSVLNQTIDDWELIIIDDGSTDNSLEVIEKYRNNPSITIIEQENKGLNVTNNVAVRLARGKYIVRLDADDYFDENFLLVLSNILDKKEEIGLVYPDYYHVNKDGEITEAIRRKKIGDEVKLLDLPAHGACTMIRKELLVGLDSYNEEFTCQDGYDLWLRFIKKHKPYNVNIPLFYYRRHGENSTEQQQKILYTRSVIKRKFVENNGGAKLTILGVVPVLNSSIYKQNRPLIELCGKPLLWYTLKEAQNAQCLDRVVVACENDEVLSYVNDNFPDFTTLKREGKHARPDSNSIDLLQFILEHLEGSENYVPDAICELYISTPLRKAMHIQKASDTMEIFGVDSVISIQEELNPYFHHERFGLKPINISNYGMSRLERKAIYKGNGAIHLLKTAVIKRGEMLGKSVGHISMLPEESIKINTDYEFWLVSKIMLEWIELN